MVVAFDLSGKGSVSERQRGKADRTTGAGVKPPSFKLIGDVT